MQGIEDEPGHTQLSVGWLGNAPEPTDPTLERAAAYATVLARTLAAAGFEPRHLSVGVRREPQGLLQLTVHGEIPGISRPDFESLARATLNGVGRRLGFSAEGDLVLVAYLEPEASVEVTTVPITAPSAARVDRSVTAERVSFFERLPLGRLAIGLALGLLLGVLGLPRLELSVPGLQGASPAAAPTTAPPQILAVQSVPTEAPPAAKPTVAPPSPTPVGPRVLFAQRFDTPIPNWTNDSRGTAWFENGEYRLFAREPGRFVAVSVPLPSAVQDAEIAAQFHKVGGPSGGGYGLIVRDQGAAEQRDGRNQSGQYLVFEVGDRGDFGVWQRDQTRWIDVVPWTHSEAVRTDQDANVLAVTLRGNTLRMQVNGLVIADLGYDRLPAVGGVGIFTGGDLNQVALEWLRIETL